MFNIHWIPQHREAGDRDFFASLHPRFIKVVWDGEPAYCEDVQAAGAGYIYRDYQLSENWGNRDLISRQHAIDVGHAHANHCWGIHDRLIARGFPRNRIWFEGLNEPQVWRPEERPHWVSLYYEAFLNSLHNFGGRGVVGNLGVGWPGNSGPDTPVDWSKFSEMFDAMITRGDHTDYLGLHEYWAYDGPCQNWGWWAGRCFQVPVNVPILLTECGIDGGVAGQPNKGWGSLPGNRDEKAARYCIELWQYMDLLRDDQRVQGILPFTYDGEMNDWEEFNLKDGTFLNALGRQIDTHGMPQAQVYDPDADVPPNPIVPPEPPEPPGDLEERVARLEQKLSALAAGYAALAQMLNT